MNECYLDDDGMGPEVHAVEAGEDPQALCVRVGPVFYEHGQGKEPGVWIEYQERHMRGPLTGPVLLTPDVWRQLNRAVERKLRRKMTLRRRVRARIARHENLFIFMWYLHLVKNEDPELWRQARGCLPQPEGAPRAEEVIRKLRDDDD